MADFSDFLELNKIKENTYCNKGSLLELNGVVFGGHLVSLAVKSALQTMPSSLEGTNWSINSVHSNFIRPTRPDTVTYEVYNKRDGQIFSHRNVVARQNEKIVFTCSVSFKSHDSEGAHLPYNDDKIDVSSLPGPNDTEIEYQNITHGCSIFASQFIDQLPFYFHFYPPGYWNMIKRDTRQHLELAGHEESFLPKELYWIKSKKLLAKSDDHNEHCIGLIAASDAVMPGLILNLYPNYPLSLMATINHSVWFDNNHVNMNQWNLFNVKCLSSNVHGNSLNISKMYSEDGNLMATAVQQVYIRGIGDDTYQNTFRYASSSTRSTMYGGHLVSLAVKSALQTMPSSLEGTNWSINSVHSNFIRPTRPDTVTYEVYNKRDGQIFSHRNVVARQNEKIVFTCSVSFKSHDNEGAHLPYNDDILDPLSLPGPNDAESVELNTLRSYYLSNAKLPAIIKLCSPPQWLTDSANRKKLPKAPRTSLWIKPKKETVITDTNLQKILLIYASDAGMAGSVLWQYPTFKHTLITSLDHSVWFHKDDIDINKWHLYDIHCMSAGTGITLNISKIYSEDYTLVATAVQQGYIRGPKL